MNSKNNKNNYQSHMTLDDRIQIQSGLNENLNFTKIGELTGKHRTSISKEVQNNRTLVSHKDYLGKKCNNYDSCTISGLCKNVNCNGKLCKTCGHCFSVCPDFEHLKCHKIEKPPYVCNGCDKKGHCRIHERYVYSAADSHKKYKFILSSSREGIGVSKEKLELINSIVSPLVLEKGQHLYHIHAAHQEELEISLSTLYLYVKLGYLDCKLVDLPKAVSYKERKKQDDSSPKFKKDKKIRENRTYDDFLEFMKKNPDAHVVEMDTVEGVKGGALLLTLHAVAEKTQYAHFIHDKRADNIRPVFDLYRERLSDDDLFSAYFNVVLTDNGTEFSNILFLEELGCHVFFCDPYNSGQKGYCENNHKFIRYYIPKGESFDWLKMNDIWKMMSHINSTKRDSLNGKTPYELTQFIWGKALLDAFHIDYIEPDKVIFDKRLFKK